MVYMPGTHVSTMLRHGSETGPERVPVKQVRIRHTARAGEIRACELAAEKWRRGGWGGWRAIFAAISHPRWCNPECFLVSIARERGTVVGCNPTQFAKRRMLLCRLARARALPIQNPRLVESRRLHSPALSQSVSRLPRDSLSRRETCAGDCWVA